MASFWPAVQCPGTVQMKWCSPAVVRVMLVGPAVEMEMGLVALQASNAPFVTFATSCELLAKLKTVTKSIGIRLFRGGSRNYVE